MNPISAHSLPIPISLSYTGSLAMNNIRLRFSLSLGLCLSSAAYAQNQQPATPPNPFLSAPHQSDAQKANFPPQLIEQLRAIESAALSDDYAYRQLAHLTENIGPRPSGSPQAKAASDYVAAELRKLGLDVHLEEAKVPHWVRGAETAQLIEYPGQVPETTQKIVLCALGGSSATPADGLIAEVVVVNNFDELTALGRDKVAGKIVLFNEIFDKQKSAGGMAFQAYGEAVRYRGAGARVAADMGAAAALVRSVGDADFRLPHTGFSYPAGIPAGAVTAEDADLIAHLATQGKVRMHLTLTPQKLPDTTGYNVIADLKGSEHPEQVVVVSGHLDSWDLGTGAIDDGAGVVVAMEAAEILQKLHLQPKRTLRVIAWMDEETGGSGGKTYTQEHTSDIVNHIAAIESDAGAAHPLGFEAKMSNQAAEILRPALDVLQSIGANVLRETPESPGADITGMANAGVPALGILQDGRTYFHYHHTAADTLDKVVPSELRENAAAMAVMGYALASMKDPLPR
jgi:carboxypeptidase Q